MQRKQAGRCAAPTTRGAAQPTMRVLKGVDMLAVRMDFSSHRSNHIFSGLPFIFFFASEAQQYEIEQRGTQEVHTAMMAATSTSVLYPAVSDITALFSDIDGTLAHYAKTLGTLGYEQLSHPLANWNDNGEDADPIDALLVDCFPQSFRDERFGTAPHQFWRHTATGKVLKMYALYNLSLTGAVISENTILLMELLQSAAYLYKGQETTPDAALATPNLRLPVLCCLITGARTSTFARRRREGALPQTAFESCEGGSKLWCRLADPGAWFAVRAAAGAEKESQERQALFFPHKTDALIDAEWTNSFSSVTAYRVENSTDENEGLRAARQTMWDLEAELRVAGFATDHDSYDTSFLIDIRRSPCPHENQLKCDGASPSYPRVFRDAEEAERHVVAQFRAVFNDKYGVELFVNLGKGQINARGGGKRGVMLRVLQRATALDEEANGTNSSRRRFSAEHSIALFDDENDLQFAELCGAGILPSIAHEQVLEHEQWTCEPLMRKWFRPPHDGPLGSEWALKQVVLFKRQRAASK